MVLRPGLPPQQLDVPHIESLIESLIETLIESLFPLFKVAPALSTA